MLGRGECERGGKATLIRYYYYYYYYENSKRDLTGKPRMGKNLSGGAPQEHEPIIQDRNASQPRPSKRKGVARKG